jgi:hypothetical protein
VAVIQKEADAVDGADRGEDARLVREVNEAADRHRDEPHGGDRAEPRGDRRGAPALHAEERDQDREAERDHVGLEGGRRELQALDRREHGDRRRDDRVAVEQGGAGHSQQRHREHVVTHRALQERHQRERAALAVVVGAHDQEDVLQRDDDYGAHSISDITPSTISRVSWPPAEAAVRLSLSA